MSPSIQLANWLKDRVVPLDHLRLQKLLFYAYGAAVAARLDSEIGEVRFSAWKHGPVNVDVYRQHRESGRVPLPRPSPEDVPHYSTELQQVLAGVIAVYGRLSSWQLREESHLERPWSQTPQSKEIDPVLFRDYFVRKFSGRVRMPRYLLRSTSYEVDGLPAQSWASLMELAEALS